MERGKYPFVREEDVAEVREIVAKMTTRKRPEGDRTDAERWFENAATALREHAIAILAALLVLVLLSWITERDTVRDAFFAASALLGLLLIAASFIGIGGALPFLNRLRKAPYSSLLSAAKGDSQTDLPLVNMLLACNRNAVAFELAQYKHARNSFERRGALLAGAIDKVGLFPAIATFVGVASTLWSHSENLIRILVFIIPAFYFMNFLSWMLLQEMDRTIAMLEYSLAVRDALELDAKDE